MENKDLTNINDAAYQELIDNITTLWGEAKSKAIAAVNTELLDANWQTGKYIVEYEQGGKQRAEYGKRLLVNLAKDLTARNGKGFNRTNLTYMRKLYLAFPKCGTLSHKLTWSHYYELLKCDNTLEMQFYYKESIKECWKVRELKRQMKRLSNKYSTNQYWYVDPAIVNNSFIQTFTTQYYGKIKLKDPIKRHHRKYLGSYAPAL